MLFFNIVDSRLNSIFFDILNTTFIDFDILNKLLDIKFKFENNIVETESNKDTTKDVKLDIKREVELHFISLTKKENKIGVIALMRKLFNTGILDAKNLVDNPPKLITKIIFKDFEDIKKQFEALGSIVEIKE